MGFGGAILFVGVWVLSQPVFAAAEVPPCITQNGNVMEEDVPSDGDRMKWAQEGLEAHNKFRQQHGAHDLVLNQKICKSAQWTANHDANVGDEGNATNSEDIDREIGMVCGESISLYFDSTPQLKPASDTVQSWYDEIKKYNFENRNASVFHEIAHFTQLVWKETKEMCMVYAQAKNGAFYIVAQYYPPGNYPGEDEIKNVLPLGSPVLDDPTTAAPSPAKPRPSDPPNAAGGIQLPKILVLPALCFQVFRTLKSNFA